MKFVGQELDNMVLRLTDIRLWVSLSIVYSYISFFDLWNAYIMRLL